MRGKSLTIVGWGAANYVATKKRAVVWGGSSSNSRESRVLFWAVVFSADVVGAPKGLVFGGTTELLI